MPKLAILIGNLLIILGLVGYFVFAGDGAASWTALIPALIGLPIELAGIAALAMPRMRKHAMHGALLFAVLGVLGTAPGILKLPTLLSDSSQLARPTAVAVQSITFVLCAVLIVAGVLSFLKARRAS